LKEWDPAIITGDTPDSVRDNAVRRFQSRETRLFIGSLGAAGVGLTLTAASHGVMVEFQWQDMRQAEDRIHRIGQHDGVLWQYLVYDWSVDANMLKMVWEKMAVVERALDGKRKGIRLNHTTRHFDETTLYEPVELWRDSSGNENLLHAGADPLSAPSQGESLAFDGKGFGCQVVLHEPTVSPKVS